MSHPFSRRSLLAAGLALPVADRPDEKKPRATKSKSAVRLRYRILGKTGLKATEVGFGCEAVSDVTVFETALDLGINFFDTARSYEGGNNERVLGKALGARRKNVILCSRSYGKDRKSIVADLDVSLKELGTDYLDIWYIGNKDKPELITEDMLEAQAAAQRQGKIRFKGISTHRLYDMLSFITGRRPFDIVLTAYNFTMDTRYDRALAEFQKAGLGVVAMKVMAGGYRGANPKQPNYAVFLRPRVHLAALKWALRRDWVQTAVPTMRDRDQLEENLLAMAEPFTEQDQKILTAHLERIKPLVCRMCGSCDGLCPRGLPVSDLVRYVTYAEGYGSFAMGHERFQRLPAELRAVRCSDCKRCLVACPNGVRVRERVTRAQELFG